MGKSRTISDIADDLEDVCSQHTREYDKRVRLWRLRQIDIMELRCVDANDKIERLNIELSDALGLSGNHMFGNDRLVLMARERVAA